MAFISTAVSFSPLLTTVVLHFRSDARNPSADPRCNVSKLIEITGRAMSAWLQSHAGGPSPGFRVSLPNCQGCQFPVPKATFCPSALAAPIAAARPLSAGSLGGRLNESLLPVSVHVR